MSSPVYSEQRLLLGHPAGLYIAFVSELWERFSYYGMKALLVFYMIKDFLGYGDSDAYTIYGSYTALVYMTPFFGGMLADRLLGVRKAILFGGVLLALGQFFLMWPDKWMFFMGLGLLIVGNGFFKPNISNLVGLQYRNLPGKRDGGFTIYYMGINLGAAMAPLLCGFIGETYGWHWGFGLAGIGMITGLIVYVVPPLIAQMVVSVTALLASGMLLKFHPADPMMTAFNIFVALCMLIGGGITVAAIQRGGLPKQIGAPPDPERLRRRVGGAIPAEWLVYIVAILLVPCFMGFVSGGAALRSDHRPMMFVEKSTIEKMEASESVSVRVSAVLLKQISTPAGFILSLSTLLAFGYLLFETFRLDAVARHRMYVVLILTFFCCVFWSFFEQMGSSTNNFTDRNIDRVPDAAVTRVIKESDVGASILLQPTQEQLGYRNGDSLFTIDVLNKLREEHQKERERRGGKSSDAKLLEIEWKVAPDNVGMKIAPRSSEIPATMFQSLNPIYILLFGLVFTALWTYLGAHGMEPSTPLKFAAGLFQLGLGFGAAWWGAQTADARGMVAMHWLLLMYLLHTTAELCISPVGLSMITKLSPMRLVGTVLGGWYLATAIAQFTASIIAQFTRVGDGETAGAAIPPPIDTLHTYGDVFGYLALGAFGFAAVCLLLVPKLKQWMHEGETA